MTISASIERVSAGHSPAQSPSQSAVLLRPHRFETSACSRALSMDSFGPCALNKCLSRSLLSNIVPCCRSTFLALLHKFNLGRVGPNLDAAMSLRPSEGCQDL